MAIYDKGSQHEGMNTRGVTTGGTLAHANPRSGSPAKARATVIDPPAGKHAEPTMVWVQWEDASQENVPVRFLSKS